MDHHRVDRGVDRSAVFHQLLWIVVFTTIAGGFAYYAASHPMDFRVYHFGARGAFDGTRPVYGPDSGLGWPMHYRYPPLFLLLFAPFAWMPLGAGAAVWVVLKVAVLAALLIFIGGGSLTANSTKNTKGTKSVFVPFAHSVPFVVSNPFSIWIPLLLAGPYIVEEFRYGNVQFFIFALTAASLLMAREKPLLSSASLALAISIKVWPLFFVPYLAVKREWKIIGCTVAFAVLLTFLPSVYFGFSGNFDLLQQWFAQEFQIQLGESEIWFPNQSLRGVLMRYLTEIDYSRVPDSNYPLVHVVALDPFVVRTFWGILAGSVYLAFLALAQKRRDQSVAGIEIAIGFCLCALLQPFTQKYALGILLFPALVAGQLVRGRAVRILVYLSIVFVLIQPLAPGPAVQRLLQVLGMDFLGTMLLTIALTATWLKFSDPSREIHKTENKIRESAMHGSPVANG